MSAEHDIGIETIVAPVMEDKRAPKTHKLELPDSYNQKGLFLQMRANTRAVGFHNGSYMATFSTPSYLDPLSATLHPEFAKMDLYTDAAERMGEIKDAWLVAYAPWWNAIEVPPVLHYLYQTREKPLPAYHYLPKEELVAFMKSDGEIIHEMRSRSGKSIFVGTNVTPGRLEGRGGQTLHGPHSQRGALRNDISSDIIQWGRKTEDWGDNGSAKLLGEKLAEALNPLYKRAGFEVTPDNRGVSFFARGFTEKDLSSPQVVNMLWRFPALATDQLLDYYHSQLFDSDRQGIISTVQGRHRLNTPMTPEEFDAMKQRHKERNFRLIASDRSEDPIVESMAALFAEGRLSLTTGFALTWQYSDEGILTMITLGIVNDRDFGPFEALPFRRIDRKSEVATQEQVEKQFKTADEILGSTILAPQIPLAA